MKVLLSVILTLLPSVIVAQAPKVAACTFSEAESFHVGHGHDLNTGKVIVGETIINIDAKRAAKYAGKYGGKVPKGSGCAPAWAVSGNLEDETPTKVEPKALPPPAAPVAPKSPAPVVPKSPAAVVPKPPAPVVPAGTLKPTPPAPKAPAASPLPPKIPIPVGQVEEEDDDEDDSWW